VDVTGEVALRVRVLGPLEVIDATGRPLALGPPKQRTLLALLLVRAGTVVPAELLVDELWPDPPASAQTNLRTYTSSLRRALEPTAGVPALTKTGSGYMATIPPEEFDLECWRMHVDAGTVALGDGDPAAAAAHLRDGLELWRGPALADVPLGSVLVAWRESIHEERLATMEDAIETMLRLGRLNVAIQQARDLLGVSPLRERAAGLLMRACYEAGDAAGALAVYDRIRRAMVDGLGIEPGEELRELQRGVLRRRLEPLVRQPAASSPRTDTTVPRQLPADVPGFTGRRAVLERLDSLLTTGQEDLPAAAVVISAIAGTAGVGKTALAIHWAHRVAGRFPDGQVYINLRGFAPGDGAMSPSEAVRVLLDTLGVAPQRIPATLDAQVGLYRSLLDGRKILLVLDNAADADQVRPLLPTAPGCLAVVTSRRRLSGLVAIDGAHPLTVDLLTTDEARTMLIGRLGPDRIVAEPDAVEEIINLCARLPMALAIVAARAAIHPDFRLADLAEQLRETKGRLDGFDDGDSVTMRAVFSWSYRTLSDPAARLFRLLGLHPGLDVGAAAAASLAGQPVRQVRSALAELAHAHLLAEPTPGRYAFHDLLRAYAAELAEEVDPEHARQAATRRILDHYLHTAYGADRLLRPDRERIDLDPPALGVTPEKAVDHHGALAWFTTEHPVLMIAIGYAVDHGLDRHAWQLAWTVENVLDWRGQWHELGSIQRTALSAAQRSADATGQAHAHRGVARAYIRSGRYDDAARHLEAALDLFATLGDDAGRAAAHRSLAVALVRQGRYDAALKHDQRALDLHRAAGDLAGQAITLNNLGYHHAQFGDLNAALDYCQQALNLSRQIGDRDAEARTWASLGSVHQRLSHHAEAVSCHRQAIDLLRDLGDRTAEAESLTNLGDTYDAAANRAMSRVVWQEALALLTEIGHPDAERVRRRLNRE
jgi:DNA-binding SARP family transcriptional activator/tetratricopeptide (TPR) repeat protein